MCLVRYGVRLTGREGLARMRRGTTGVLVANAADPAAVMWHLPRHGGGDVKMTRLCSAGNLNAVFPSAPGGL